MWNLYLLHQGNWVWYGRQRELSEALRLTSKHRARIIKIEPDFDIQQPLITIQG